MAAASVMAPPSVVSGFSKEKPSELSMVMSRNNTKDLVEVVKEHDDYFLKAADVGSHVPLLLEAPNSGFSDNSKACQRASLACKVHSYGWSLSPSLWTWVSSPKLNGLGLGKLAEGTSVSVGGHLGLMELEVLGTVPR